MLSLRSLAHYLRLQELRLRLHPLRASANQAVHINRATNGALAGNTASKNATCTLSRCRVLRVLISIFNTAE